MKSENLFRNIGYWTSKIQLNLYDELLGYLEREKINKTQFAKKLGVSKGYISQVLNGDFNHKISKLVELSLAINKVPKIEFIDVDELVKENSEGTKTITWKLKETPKPNIIIEAEGTGIEEDSVIQFKDPIELLYAQNE